VAIAAGSLYRLKFPAYCSATGLVSEVVSHGMLRTIRE
jgi:hypothetical protein